MKCPVCKNHEHAAIHLRAEGFAEGLYECRICKSMWSINHGATEIVRDSQEKSFLEAVTECVEGDDYFLVA